MLHTVGQLKDSIAGLLTGTNLNNVTNLNGAIERAARTLVQQADVPEASGIQAITLYSGVNYYLAPSTIFGGAINLIQRQGAAQSPMDYTYKVPLEQFTRTKTLLPNGFMLSLEYQNGTALLGIASPIPFPRVILDPMNQTDDWTAAGSASNLVADSTNYYQQPASLRFLLTGSSTGTLTKTLPNALSMADYEDVGVAFLAIQIPAGATASTLTSIALKLGSDSTNYNEVIDTEGFLGAWVAGQWLLVALDFSAATQTGTPDWSAIDYVQVSLAHSATITNMRVGGLWMSLPSPCEIFYQSAAIFMETGENPTQDINDDNDTIILNDAAYTLLEYESAKTVLEQDSGGVGSQLYQMYTEKLYGDQGLYNKYRADNPSAELRTVGSWYDTGGVGY